MSDEITNEVLETPVVEAPVEDKFDKLSNRDALEKAINESKDNIPEERTPAVPTQKEVKAAVAADIEPPAEFSAAGKKAWTEKNLPEIQKEYQRIHHSRTQEITRAQKAERDAKEEAKTWRELGKMAAPYIEARGADGVTPQQAMMEALALIQEFKKGDPSSVKAELKKIGIDLDSPASQNGKVDDSKISTLQERLDRLESEREAQVYQSTVQTFESVFNKLGAEKTRTGEPVFPGLLDSSESGLQLAREIGSLTQDPRFQQGVLRRFPGADLTVVVREAYKYLGGQVSGEPVSVSTNQPKHIEKSRRAAASTPGGVVRRNDSSNLVGKLSNRAALIKAMEDFQEH